MALVSCEVKGSQLELFLQEQDGSITRVKRPHQPWMICPVKRDGLWVELEGRGHYRFIKKYKDKEEFWREYRSVGDKFAIFDDREAALALASFNYYKGLKPKAVSVLAFDLETRSLAFDKASRILLISNTYRSGDRVERKLFAYDEYESQGDMISAWCRWVRAKDPSIVVGHNIFGFDLPYLRHVAQFSGVKLDLGRDGSAIQFDRHSSNFRKDQAQSISFTNARIYGRELVDTLFLAIKSRKYDSYGLKAIIKTEGLERDDRQHFEAAQIGKLYKDPTEWAKIKRYAVHDADDSLALWDKYGPPFFFLSQQIPKTFQQIVNSASGSQINSFLVRPYLTLGHSLPKASEVGAFEGAISIGNPGRYRNCVKFDVASLYPSIMLEYQIFNQEKDPKGHFIEMLERFTVERLAMKAKAKADHDQEAQAISDAYKIIINSGFGFMGAGGLNFNSPEHAQAVTAKGREILTKAIEWSKLWSLILVNADTDSITVCKGDQSPIDETERASLLESMNSIFPSRIRWEDDGYYDCVLVTKAKNYVLKSGDKVKYKGNSLLAPMKEPALREFISRVVDALLSGATDIQEVEAEYIKEIESPWLDIKRWASRRSITEAVLDPARTNERRVLEAIDGTDYQAGDKINVYFTESGALKLAEHWAGDHDKKRLIQKLKKTKAIFKGVL